MFQLHHVVYYHHFTMLSKWTLAHCHHVHHISSQVNGPSCVDKSCQNRPIIGYTGIWYTWTSFCYKVKQVFPHSHPLPYPFAVFPTLIFLRHPHNLNGEAHPYLRFMGVTHPWSNMLPIRTWMHSNVRDDSWKFLAELQSFWSKADS